MPEVAAAAMDELRARRSHELRLPHSHKSSGELVVGDDARLSSFAITWTPVASDRFVTGGVARELLERQITLR